MAKYQADGVERKVNLPTPFLLLFSSVVSVRLTLQGSSSAFEVIFLHSQGKDGAWLQTARNIEDIPFCRIAKRVVCMC